MASFEALLSGPRVAFALLCLGLAAAPLESLRIRGSITIADALIAAGMGVAVISRREDRMRLPALWMFVSLVGTSTALWHFWLDPATFRRSVVQFVIVAYTHFLIPLFIVQWYREDGRAIRVLVGAWLLGAAVGAFVAILESRGLAPGFLAPFLKERGARVAGLTYHSTTLGFNSSLALSGALVLLLESRRALALIGWGSIIAVTLMAANLSGSRTSIVAPLVGISVVISAQMLFGQLRTISVRRLFFLLAGFVVLAAFMGSSQTDRAESAFARIIGGDSSNYSDILREQQRSRSLENIWEQPIAGNGYQRIGMAHHRFLELWEAGGLVMLLAFTLTMVFLGVLVAGALRYVAMHPQRDLYWAMISVYISYWAVYWAHSGLFSRSVGVTWGLLMLVTMHILHTGNCSRRGTGQTSFSTA